jgi:hypothetical protein
MESSLPIESPFTRSHVCPKAPSLVSLGRELSSKDVSEKSTGTDSASALHFEPIFVDFETPDLGIERSRGQP